MNLLSLSGLSVFYGDFQALFDVSLEVGEGETVAIVGANGAGKSTLLQAISGLVPAASGDIRYEGRSIVRVPAHERVRRGIALVPEGRRIFPSLTAHENLLIGGYGRRPGDWTPARVYELFPQLRERARLDGTTLSGGEQQMAAIGRALMANPRLLLLDEVSLGLAPRVVKQLYAAITGIVAAGTTLVLVEQDVGQALRIANRVYCLLEGRVSFQGAPAELEHERLTAAYFGR